MSVGPSFYKILGWIGDLGVRCMRRPSLERTARLSPEWGKLETKQLGCRHKL